MVGIPIAAGVLYPFVGLRLSPMIAAGAMALSSLSVVSNANRLRGFHSEAPTRGVAGRGGEPRVEIGGSDPQPVEDPVCGMEVDPASAVTAVAADGTTRHFCSTGCRDHFLASQR